MSRLFQFAILATLVVLPSFAMAGDTEIAQAIVKRLQDEKAQGKLKGFNIGLRVEEGVVWLEGHVSQPAQHDLAIDIARRVEGVQRVVDGIRIEGVEPVVKPRELAAASLEEEIAPEAEAEVGLEAPALQPVALASPQAKTPAAALPEVPQLVAQPIEMAAAQPEATPEFSFRPVQHVSAQKKVETTPAASNGPQAMRPLRPVPAQNAVAQAPYGARPVYRTASAANMANAQIPMASGVAPPAYYPQGYGRAGYGHPVRYDHPRMPPYAWPAYAAHPNYAAVTYPLQHSPMAWPYIGPFYPYPQVPLGWRKVEMEWEDGWWTLDFKARRHNSF